MPIRLGEYVVEGGLHSDGKYHTQGWVELREVGRSEGDWPMRLRFSVTGDPDPDLMGKRGTDWITHFSTYDHCGRCDEEMDLEIEEWEREKRERGELEEE